MSLTITESVESSRLSDRGDWRKDLTLDQIMESNLFVRTGSMGNYDSQRG